MGLEATSRESLAVGRLPQSLAARRGAVAVQPIRVSVVLTELWPEIAPARRLYFGPRDFGSSCGSLPAIARNPPIRWIREEATGTRLMRPTKCKLQSYAIPFPTEPVYPYLSSQG